MTPDPSKIFGPAAPGLRLAILTTAIAVVAIISFCRKWRAGLTSPKELLLNLLGLPGGVAAGLLVASCLAYVILHSYLEDFLNKVAPPELRARANWGKDDYNGPS